MKSQYFHALSALTAGAVFGAGLALSGMLDPSRVTGFLDIGSGRWDPSLALVLGGAVLVAFAGVAVMRKMGKPLLDERFHLPGHHKVDAPLLFGSVLFGVGWGLSGYCPGPAIASLSLGVLPVLTFTAPMIAGMIIHDRIAARVSK